MVLLGIGEAALYGLFSPAVNFFAPVGESQRVSPIFGILPNMTGQDFNMIFTMSTLA